ncbi:unnamed protein product [Adineta ricciae]|uniref:Uncharacterized protein n=1 Tax=Adineta ricciae TaxID=249248 RepID=A0A813TL11_ADIRI|nr:unnamed protein product [Adineta ricciae]CAF0812626.1 unnamed protein product [Adineta ricciae]
MSLPTGMSPATGMHYQNIAAQMQAYVNNGNRSYHSHPSHLQPAFGGMHQFQPTHGFAEASRAAANMIGINPVVTNDVGAFARTFVRNLIHQ